MISSKRFAQQCEQNIENSRQVVGKIPSNLKTRRKAALVEELKPLDEQLRKHREILVKSEAHKNSGYIKRPYYGNE